MPEFNYPEKQAYITSFIKNWDYHRIPFNYLSEGFFIALLGTVVSFMALRFRKTEGSGSLLIFRLFILSFFVSAVLSLVTHLPPDKMTTLQIMMPGRYINVNIMMFVPLMLGLLAIRSNAPAGKMFLAFFILAALVVKIALPQTTLNVFTLSKDLQTVMRLAFMVFLPLPVLISLIRPGLLSRVNSRAATILYLAAIYSLSLLSAVLLSQAVKFEPDRLKINDPVLNAAAAGKGMLLLSVEPPPYPLQTLIRRPTPIDPDALDGFLYAPESAPSLNRLMEKIYGMNLLVPPPREDGSTMHAAAIPRIYKKLWEERSPDTWLKIRKEFGVTEILTTPDWRLQLPVAAKSDAYVLYTIPEITSLTSQ